jgi:serine/threonine protein kinase
MVEELPQFKPRMQGMKIRYPLPMAKRILKQSLQALTFLHENGIARGDFQPGNILFTLNDIDSTPEDVLRQEEGVQARSILPPVERLDGKQDKWAPDIFALRSLCCLLPAPQKGSRLNCQIWVAVSSIFLDYMCFLLTNIQTHPCLP